MRALLAALMLISLIGPVPAQEKPKWPPSPHVAATEALRPEEQLKKFHVPPGFEVQLVAADPDIRKPINIAFDAAGRLWVTETVEYPFAAEGRPGRDAVKVLEDYGPDGRARKITTFADGLNIPIGVLPVDKKTALVYSIPSIWRLTDTDGDGKADRRAELLTGFGFQDTHGMTGEFQMGIDGWVYACHGFANTSVVKGTDGSSITMQSGNTYRFKPDGSRVEYFTHGQVNPFGLAFDPAGNLYSTDCHTRPLYQLLKGAWYPSFGKPHDGLGFGPEMVTHDHGSTAIGGIAYYAAEHYPPEFRDNLFVGNVVTNRINRDRIAWTGSSPKGIEMPDLVKCDDPWFRPVDIKLGPDGCLYFADFYNRIIGHYEVPLSHPGRDRDKGRIWRIVYRGADGKGQPAAPRDLSRAVPADLVRALGDPNLAVRLHATHELVDRGGAGMAALLSTALSDERSCVHALWALERTAQLPPDLFMVAARGPAPANALHAMRILTERPRLSSAERSVAVDNLGHANPWVVRAAAQVLAAHPAPENVAPLLELRRRVPAGDKHLLHVVRMALRDQLRLDAAWATLPLPTWQDDDYRAIVDVCRGVHNRASTEFVKRYLPSYPAGASLPQYCHYIVRYGKEDAGRWVMELAQSRHAGDLLLAGQLARAVQQASQERRLTLSKDVQDWCEQVAMTLLQAKKNQEAQLGIDLAAGLKLTAAFDKIAARALDATQPEAQRKSAITTLVSLAPDRAVEPLMGLVHATSEPVALREHVAVTLGNSNHTGAQAALIKALETTPARVQAAIALGLAGSPQGGEKLLTAIEAGKASPRLVQERLIELRLRQVNVPGLDERLPRLTRNLMPLEQRVQDLLNKRRKDFLAARTDAAAGQKVFAKSCAACHQIANQGAKIGPQLDGIGIRGVERLLEDILDPSRNVDQAFRSTLLTLDSGQLVNGLVLREEGEVVILADAQGKEVRVPKTSIQERVVSPLSPMPGNFAEQLSEPDMQHLLAFLLAQRVK